MENSARKHATSSNGIDDSLIYFSWLSQSSLQKRTSFPNYNLYLRFTKVSLLLLSFFYYYCIMSIVKSSKNQDQLLLDGYRYRRANKSKTIWRCCRNNCAGRVRFDGIGYVSVTDHLHAPNPEETISIEFKSDITSSATTSHDPPRRIIHQALLNVDKINGAAVPNYSSSQRTIERKRKKKDIPLPRPTSFNEILIPDELKVTNGGERFLLYDNEDPDHRMIILSSDDDLDRLSNSEHWHSDGTFKACLIMITSF